MDNLDRKKIGDFGEKIAVKYLQNKGYKILEKNYRVQGGEIDIIAKKKKELIFVEVKTRTNQNYGWPEEAVDSKKIKRILIAGEKYLQKNNVNLYFHIDVIAILIKNKKANLKHYQNVEL